MGKNNKIEISSQLISDLKKYTEQVCVGMATFTRDDLTDTALRAMANFYGDYTPRFYKRHYYNFMDNSFEKYYRNPHGSIVRGGVELTYEDMENIYSDPVNEVFDMVYSGFHGPISVKNESVPRSTPPKEEIETYRDYLVSNINQYRDYGLNRANALSYSTIEIF